MSAGLLKLEPRRGKRFVIFTKMSLVPAKRKGSTRSPGMTLQNELQTPGMGASCPVVTNEELEAACPIGMLQGFDFPTKSPFAREATYKPDGTRRTTNLVTGQPTPTV